MVILPLESTEYVPVIAPFKTKQPLLQDSPLLLSDVPLNDPVGVPVVNVNDPTSTLVFVVAETPLPSMNNPDAAELPQPPDGAVWFSINPAMTLTPGEAWVPSSRKPEFVPYIATENSWAELPEPIVRTPIPLEETENVPPVIAVVPVLTAEPLEILSISVLTFEPVPVAEI